MKIFVTVGTQKFQFDRLIKLMDEYAKINEECEIFIQRGNSTYKPNNCKSSDFLSLDEFNVHINESDLVITHGGVSTIIKAIKKEKATIVVPRLARYKEHVDDHQIQIMDSFAKKNIIIPYIEGKSDISELIKNSEHFRPCQYESGTVEIVKTIIVYIEKWEKEMGNNRWVK